MAQSKIVKANEEIAKKVVGTYEKIEEMCIRDRYNEIPWTIKQRYLPEHLPFSAADIYSHIFQIFNGWSWDKLYRRAFVEDNGLQFQGLRTTNDAFFVFKMCIRDRLYVISLAT